MRRIFHYLFFLCAVAALAGCTEEFPSPDHFVGVIETGFTRTGYTPEGITLKGKWNAGDAITVKNENGGSAVTLTATSAAVESDFKADASVTLPEAPFIAYYPASIAGGLLPEIQMYNAAGPLEAPMAAKSPTRYLQFKPICGLLEIKLASAIGDIKLTELRLEASQPLCGSFSINDEFVARATGNTQITLDCGNGVAVGSEPVSFWLSVPQGNYSGLTLEVRTNDGRTENFTLAEGKSVEVIRAEVTTCNIALQSLTTHGTPEIAHLPNGLNFSRYIKCAARPDADWTQIVGALDDSLITSIRFLTESNITSGFRIDDGGDAPIYLSFDSSTGAITVSTPAKKYLMHELGAYMFRDLFILESIDFGNMEAPDLTSIAYMFSNCERIRSLDLRFMNTSATVRMEYLFNNCKSLESIDLSSFDTRKMTTASYMFKSCESLKKLDISNFETPSMTAATYMFAYCSLLEELDIRNISLQNVNGASFNYGLHVLASLRKLWVGENFISKDRARPSSIFVNANTPLANRPGSKGGLTIYTVQATADWLAICNLRWVHSGYYVGSPIDVRFYDINNGSELTVTWASDK